MGSTEVNPIEFRQLGLIGDPFAVPDSDSADSAGLKLAIHAATNRLLAAVEDSIADGGSSPVVVEKSTQVPGYYSIAALAAVLKSLSAEADFERVIPAYVPLDMMRVGRVRAVLNVFAERIANNAPELLIGMWTRDALQEPDVSLAEWTMLEETGFDAAAALREIDEDAERFAARVFGAAVESREGADDLETLMRVSTTRQRRLESDPAVDGALAESDDASDDPLEKAFTTPLGEIAADALTEAEPDGSTDPLLADYVIAYTKARLSPVVARGIRAYQAQGCASMAEELKVSKAPTKTLSALLRFAQGSYRCGVVLYDRLEMWENVPEDLRGNIVQTVEALRENLRGLAVLVLMLVPGTAPEMETALADARRVVWDFDELDAVREHDAAFDPEIALRWIDSASLSEQVPEWARGLVEAVPVEMSMAAACEALSEALQQAVRTCDAPDPDFVLKSLASA